MQSNLFKHFFTLNAIIYVGGGIFISMPVQPPSRRCTF